ncbi:RHS domain-containing protein [Gallibacterium anatis]|uniref:RHS domain-containing protein n=1 Tax=Gallibacterium anatis TaxID=750 RepID=A0AAX3XEN2_9PAST|nr:RHS domain-containing protein [Gallibacterium anatis]MDK9431569.1 RHS domain-containing protein [Gallibacterium anatis]WIM80652.1 RHS domain-containing protein [Gallibacterium anatis]WIM80663.1 RHS domain-containing protein [Gallibacterium anatis]
MRLENGEILAESQVEFIWDGSHLVQEIEHKTERTFTYIYSHPSSYEPLAQLAFAKGNENPTACYYYHNDQIGIPRELTDEQGKLCWYANYSGWGKRLIVMTSSVKSNSQGKNALLLTQHIILLSEKVNEFKPTK